MIFIVPHQFNPSFQESLASFFVGLGIALLIAGISLLTVATIGPTRRWLIAVHLLSTAALLPIPIGFALGGAWNGVVSFTGLVAGMLLAPFLPRSTTRRPQAHDLDLFALVMGCTIMLQGMFFFVPLDQFVSVAYDPVRPYLPWFGLCFAASGLALITVQIFAGVPRPFFIVAHLLGGGTMVVWTIALGLPAWTSVFHYGVMGMVIALLPWFSMAMCRLDPSSLQTRLSLALVSLVVLPLILAMGLITSQEERAATDQALSQQRNLATAIAENVANYIGLHSAAISTLANQLAQDTLSATDQRELLENFQRNYPDITALSTFDPDGNVLAQSDDAPIKTVVAGLSFLDEMRHTRQARLDIQMGQHAQRPLFTFIAPMLTPDGRFTGIVTAVIASNRVAEQLDWAAGEAGINAYMIDEQGQVIAQPNSTLLATIAKRMDLPPITALLSNTNTSGMLRYQAPRGARLAAYAQVPKQEWRVIIEQPVAEALASMHARRNRDFGVLLLIAIVALVVGVIISRWLVKPLTLLARATEQLANGDSAAPLPSNRVTEVAQLSTSFAAMRDRLTTRTAERDRAEARQRFLAEASMVLNTSLDYEATLSHLARLLVSELADFCIIYITIEDSQMQRLTWAHANAMQERLLAELEQHYTLDITADIPATQVMRTRQPLLVAVVSDDLLVRFAPSAEHLKIWRQFNPQSSMIVPLLAQDRVLGAITVVSTTAGRHYTPDDLKLAEELARRAALAVDNARLYREAQAAVQVRDQFFSIASHELKTPLTALMGNAQLLQRRLMREITLTERNQRAISVIVEQAERLNRMITTLLDVSRIQIGQLTIERKPVDLCALTHRVVNEIQPAVERHTVVCHDLNEPLIVIGDELRLEQVLQNLIGNAIKYSPEGGPVEVHVYTQNQQACLAVIDEGIGIPAEALPRLFRRFYRAPNIDGRYFDGMGIGLYVVNEVISLHGGSVSVESTVGQGSIFTVYLPLLPLEQQVAQPVVSNTA